MTDQISSTPLVLVTGGTGTLGKLVVPRLQAAGYRVRVLSRRAHADADGIEHVAGDLSRGEGIEAAVTGVGVIVHCAGSAKGDDVKARYLVEAASRAGSPHVVFISVAGADRVPVEGGMDGMMFGYFRSKLAAEQVIAGSGLPWTTLRATQFHDLILDTAKQMTKMPVVLLPSGFQFQPKDAAEVADRLVELAGGRPAGRVPDIGGPRIYALADLVRGYLRASDRRRPVLTFPMPGKAARAVREGALLAPDRAVGRRTWEEFLAERTGAPAEGALAAT